MNALDKSLREEYLEKLEKELKSAEMFLGEGYEYVMTFPGHDIEPLYVKDLFFASDIVTGTSIGLLEPVTYTIRQFRKDLIERIEYA